MTCGTGTIVRKCSDKVFIILTSCTVFLNSGDANEFIEGKFFLRRDGKEQYAAVFKILGYKTHPDFAFGKEFLGNAKDVALVAIEFEKGDEEALPDDDDIPDLAAFNNGVDCVDKEFYLGGYPLETVKVEGMENSRYFHYGNTGKIQKFNELFDEDDVANGGVFLHSVGASDGQNGAPFQLGSDGEYTIVGVHSGLSEVEGENF